MKKRVRKRLACSRQSCLDDVERQQAGGGGRRLQAVQGAARGAEGVPADERGFKFNTAKGNNFEG